MKTNGTSMLPATENLESTSNRKSLSFRPASRLLVLIVSAPIILSVALDFATQNYQKHPESSFSGIQKGPLSSPQKMAADTNNAKVLNVHVVPHTHDDTGWLKTVDEYFYGLNQTIQQVSVKDILDSVVASLLENPSRTFTYVEIKFFSMWWELQSDAVRDSVRFLIANKQLSFVNGGWCMHDEATTHYMGMVDSTTRGHAFLKRELGVIPKVGWQLDPFGHSATQASLMTSKVGFDALYFGRIDYQDLQLRKLQKGCEGLWDSSKNLNNTTVFWGLTGSFNGNYGSPSGYCFDIGCGKDVKDLTKMNRIQLVDTIYDFLRKIRVQSDEAQGNHIMLTMGSDFQYQRAHSNFASIDVLINSIKEFQAWKMIDINSIFSPRFEYVNIFYSSPDYYTKCKHEELMKSLRKEENGKEGEIDYTVKTDDFFPYSDREHGFWTGYFTSRASLKRFERVTSSFLLAARQIETLLDFTGTPVDPTQCQGPFEELEDAVGLIQHHDGVSGTAKQHVANDYSKRLQNGIDKVSTCTTTKLRRLFLGDNASHYLTDLRLCQRLNETVCDVSQTATIEPNKTDIYVMVYNPLGQSQTTVVLLPVSSDGLYRVRKVGDNSTKMLPSIPASKQSTKESAPYVLPFNTGDLPPIGANIFQIRFMDGESKNSMSDAAAPSVVDHLSLTMRTDPDTGDVEYSNGLINVRFDGNTGTIKQMGTPKNNATFDIQHEFGYYTSFDAKLDGDSKDTQNSGAYIFRPSTPEQALQTLAPIVTARFQNISTNCLEVHVSYEDGWVESTFRVLPGQPYLELEYTVGPIPIKDGRGKEVVSRLTTSNISQDNVYYTDSNGREFITRQKNFRPTWDLTVFEPVAGNYYPVNAAIFVEDSTGTSALAIATDRSQGGASLSDGSIDLMVHRRTLTDDARGVGEPLNETDGGVTPYPPYGKASRYGDGLIIRGKHRILVGTDGGASLARSVMDSSFAEPFIFVGSSSMEEEKDVPFRVFNFTGISSDGLPPNIMLMTRVRLKDDGSPIPKIQFLIRLSHQYGVGDAESEELSKPVSVDLANCCLPPGFLFKEIKELTLSGNQHHSVWTKSRLNWSVGDKHDPKIIKNDTSRQRERQQKGSQIELKPMDIRTFQVTVALRVDDIKADMSNASDS